MAAYDIVWSATVSGATGASLGAVVGLLNGYVIASNANIALGCIPGYIVASTPDPSGNCNLQVSGTIPAAVSGLGIGPASPVIASNGALARKAAPIYGTDWVVGDCDAAGNIVLSWGISHLKPPQTQPITGACTLEQFGAVGDGVTDDTAAMVSAIAALTGGSFRTISLGAKTYLMATAGSRPFVIPAGCSVIGQGMFQSILKLTGDAGCLRVGGESVTIKDVEVLGDDPSPCTNNHRNQYAVANGLTGGTSSFSHCLVENVFAKDCGGNCFQFYRPQGYLNQFGSIVIGCIADTGWTGFYTAEQHEYVHFVGCKAVLMHNYGIYVGSGNISATGCSFSRGDFINVYLDTGTNDSHGVFSGCQINHASFRLIYSANIANGFTFSGCHIIASNMEFVSAIGVQFSDCEMNGEGFTWIFNATSGLEFSDCLFYGLDPTVTLTSDPDVFFGAGNRKIDGSVPAWIAAFQEPKVTVADGTNTLTKIQSRARRVYLSSGGTTAAFTVKGQFPPYQGIPPITVCNDNAQTVHFGFSSGGTTDVTTGAIATIGCSDGTNSRKVA
jgi:hypothetical protein